MAKQSKAVIQGYLTCDDPEIQNKYINILDSFWHKDEGWVLQPDSTAADANGNINMVFKRGDGQTATVFIDNNQLPPELPISYITGLIDELANKVDKVSGKGLSTHDFTTLLRQKLETGVATAAQGAKADTALQPGDNTSELLNDGFDGTSPYLVVKDSYRFIKRLFSTDDIDTEVLAQDKSGYFGIKINNNTGTPTSEFSPTGMPEGFVYSLEGGITRMAALKLLVYGGAREIFITDFAGNVFTKEYSVNGNATTGWKKNTARDITKTSDIALNDGSDGTSTYVEQDELGTAAFTNSGDYILLAEKGAPNGVAVLDSNGKLVSAQYGDLAVTDTIQATETTLTAFVANQAAYTFQMGDIIVLSPDVDGNISHYLFKGGDKSLEASYSLLNATKIPISAVIGLQAELDTKELLSNKKQDIEANKTSTTFYASIKAIYDWAVAKFATFAQGAKADNSIQYGTKGTSIGSGFITPEFVFDDALTGSFDNILSPGWYFVGDTSTETPIGTGGIWYLNVIRYANYNICQLAYPYGAGEGAGVHYRTKFQGDWSTWRELADTDQTATAAQGAKADTALQPGDNTSELINNGETGGSRYVEQNELGTAAYTNSGDYILLAEKGAPNGVAILDGNGKIVETQYGDLAVTDTIPATETTLTPFVANQTVYTFQMGDIIILSPDVDGNISHYLFKGGDKSLEASYSLLNATKIPISSVIGLQTELDAKELLSNKKQDIEANKTSTTFIASIKAIFDWGVGSFVDLLTNQTIFGTKTFNGFTSTIYPLIAPIKITGKGTGALTTITTAIAAGVDPHSVTADPTGRFVYVANLASDDVSMYSINQSTGVLTSISTPISSGTSPFSITSDPTGRFVYTANRVSNNVSMFLINQSTGVLTSISTAIASRTDPRSITSDPTGRFVYTVNLGSNSVSMYSINQSTGALTTITTAIAAGTNPFSVTCDPTGRFVYVANLGSNNVSMYSINQSTGALTSISTPISSGTSPHSVTADPTGRFVYVANRGGDSVSMYSINQSTGALTSITTAIAAGTDPISVTCDPTGRFVYFANAASNDVSMFSINQSTGVLTSISTPIASGTEPRSVTADPTGRFVYVANLGSDDVSMFSINNFSAGSGTFSGNVKADKFEGELFQKRIETTVNGIDTPVNAAFTAASGTLTAGTYYYRVSAINEYGETLASTETSFTLNLVGGVNVNWGAVTGATGYKVYGRVQGGQLLIASVGLVTTYHDNGSITPSGALPSENTTGFYLLDWKKSVHVLTLNVGTTLINTNLPQGDSTKIIEMIVSGNQTVVPPNLTEGFPSNDTPIGTVRRHYVFSCINGNAGSEIILYQLTNLAS